MRRERSRGRQAGDLCERIKPVVNEIFLNLRFADAALVARMPPQAMPAPGMELTFAFRPERMHLFDPISELRLGID